MLNAYTNEHLGSHGSGHFSIICPQLQVKLLLCLHFRISWTLMKRWLSCLLQSSMILIILGKPTLTSSIQIPMWLNSTTTC